MCGIIGYIGYKEAVEVVFSGLEKLEYRGYDSSGIAVSHANEVSFIKSEGKLSNLAPLLKDLPKKSAAGMGHTRWATHGSPNTANAHPHVCQGVALIHNGIIENYQELKQNLLKQDVKFSSDTDTEVVLHLLIAELKQTNSAKSALINVLRRIEGAYSLAFIWEKDPDHIYLAKQGSPLVVGIGHDENFFASDALALISHTKKVVFLNDGEIASISKDETCFFDFEGNNVARSAVELNWSGLSASKSGYRHFMLKEIHEQPAIIESMINRLINFSNRTFNDQSLGINQINLNKVQRIHLVACGTAYYSGLTIKYALESILRLPVEVELASEFRYRDPYINESTLVIPITQSGETADTLACVKYAKDKGCQTLAICNVMYSSIARVSDSVLYMEAGPEIGVASTKAFTSMILSMYIMALAMARKKNLLSTNELEEHFAKIQKLPELVSESIKESNFIEDISNKYYEYTNCIFIGRGMSYPISLEGSLKLKEISYIHAEGYAGGELKHGPIALIDKHMPIVALNPKDRHREKMLSNIEEIRARDGRILGVGADDDEKFKAICHDYIPVPQIDNETLQAILSVVPLQLFSYYVAVKRGTDVDQPRNLAKSVTVE
ncbi:MAG: glutamine--fructose-6-phosphate transaminase (isomerizing) [Bdellovibrionota bacterium]